MDNQANDDSLQILLVEDNPTDALLIEDALEQMRGVKITLTLVKRLDEALARLQAESFDAVLLDLGLPDCAGLETFTRTQSQYPTVPILVLSGLDDETLALTAVQDGAQDYLVKGKLNSVMLARTIRYAIERKRTAEKLAVSELGYRRLFEAAQDGILILDAVTGKITDANPFLEKLLGHSNSEFIGKRLWEISPFRDKQANQAAFRTLQHTGYIRYDDLPLATKDGRQINVEFVSNIYGVGDKQVIQCNIRDITERKRAEARQRLLVQGLGQVVAVADELLTAPNLDHLFQQAIELARERLGLERCSLYLIDRPGQTLCGTYGTTLGGETNDERAVREPLAGFWADELLSPHPLNDNGDDSDVSRETVSSPNQKRWVLDARHPLVEYEVQEGGVSAVATGLTGWVAATPIFSAEGATGVMFNDAGHTNAPVDETKQELLVVYCSLLGRIIERLRTEERLQQVVEGAHCLLWQANVEAQGDTFSWDIKIHNEEAAQEYLPIVIPLGGTYSDGFFPAKHEDDLERMTVTAEAALRSGKSRYFQEYRFRSLDGSVRWLCEDVSIEQKRPGQWTLIGVCTDITERKQAEEALLTSEARFKIVSRATNDAIYDWDLRTDDIWWNEGFHTLFGYDREQIESGDECWESRIHPDDWDRVRTSYRTVIESEEQSWSHEYRFRRADGSYAVSFDRAFIIRDGNQQPIRMVGSIQDITERKQAEEEKARLQTEAEQQRRRLDNIVASVPGVVWEAWGQPDAATQRIDFVSDYVETMLGYTAAEWLATANCWLSRVHPDDKKQAARESVEMFASGQGGASQFRWMAKDGHTVWVEAQSVVICDEAGRSVGMRGVTIDISERRQAEEELRDSEARKGAVLETALDCIIGIDAQSRILEWNPASEKTFGYAREEVIGKLLPEFIMPESLREAHFAGMEKCLATGEGPLLGQRVEMPALRRNGEEFPVELAITRIESEGQPVFIAYLRDITESKQAQETLRASEELNRGILESMTDAFFSLDTQWRFTQINSQTARLWHKNAEEMLGKSLWEVDPAVVGSKFDAEYHRAVEEQVVVNFEAFYAPGNAWREVHAYPSPIGLSVYFRDITERKQAEQQLQDSKARFESIVANVPGMVYQFALQPDGSVAFPFVSEGCRELFGVEPEQIQREPNSPIQMIDDADRAEFDRAVAASVAALTPWSWEGRFRLPSGQTKWMQGAARPRRLPGGGTLWDGLLMDITARKEAEEERDRFFTLSLDMLAIIGSDGYIKRLNPAFEATLGFSDAELMAVSFLEFVHPDDHAKTLEGAATLARGLSVTEFENRYRCRDNSYKWLRWSVAPFENLWYCVAHDVTGEKEAEAALLKANDGLESHVLERTAELAQANEELSLRKTILESQGEASIDGILVVDEEAKIVSFNRRFIEMWDIPPEVIATQSDTAALQVVVDKLQDPESFLTRVAYLYKHRDERSQEEIVLKDGRTFERYSAPVKGVEGFNYGRIWFFHDITERKQAGVELQHAKQEADAANLAKSEFLSRMSHELRTPLNSILGFGQILEKQELTPLSKESVSYILKGGRHLLDLINEVLDIARVEAGRLELSLEPIALDDVVPEACNMVRPLAAERNIRLDENASTLNGNHVLADRQRLKQVLINLLSNAIKYNREGGQVEVSCEQKPDGWTSITVRDTGPGISPEDLPKLFMPFERLSASTSEIEGTGLGLVLSQRLVTAMGGSLNVESAPGRGSTFTITLPHTAPPEEQVANMPHKPDSVGARHETGEAYSVLCIEDNPSNIRLMETIFEMRPEITLMAAVQGSVGLDLARQHEPDLILLDLNLPDIHGSEVLARLQQSAITRDIPVVVVSADATPNQIERLLVGGARAYLTKPLDVNQFLDTVDKFLQVAPVIVT